MKGKENQPDWGKIAEKFDLWLPQIAPVGEVLLDKLQASRGDKILDVASGTGEPALTLARRMQGHVEITGTDAADGMVKVAQAKVEKEGLQHIRFLNMPAESLNFNDASFDKVLCRFGVMLFADSQQGTNEMFRVLKPGGRFALSVWSTPESMTTMYWAHKVFSGRIPEAAQPPLHKVTSLGISGALEAVLEKAGFREFKVEKKQLNYEFTSFDAYWDLVESSDIMKMQFDALPIGEKQKVRDEIAQFAMEFVTDHGISMPHEYVIAYGVK